MKKIVLLVLFASGCGGGYSQTPTSTPVTSPQSSECQSHWAVRYISHLHEWKRPDLYLHQLYPHWNDIYGSR